MKISSHPFNDASPSLDCFIHARPRLAWILSLLLPAVFLGWITAAQAGQVTLGWNPNPESSVTGYRVHQGTSSRNYTVHQDAGFSLTSTLSSLSDSTTYFFAVTAYDAVGRESDYSSEVSFTPTATTTPPTISLTSPSTGQGFQAPATVLIKASVTANGNTVSSVQYLNGSTVLGQVSTAPYDFNWTAVPAGSYSLKARVIYGAGLTLDSSVVSISVTNAPTSSDNSGTVTLGWNANPESNIAGYRVYQGTASRSYSRSVDAGLNLSQKLDSLAVGVPLYLTVTAYNTSGRESDYSTEIVYTPTTSTTPSTPPTVALTSPVTGQSYTAPATLALAAAVTANGNIINRVQFLSGTTVVGESYSTPYSFNWAGVGAGSYALSARVVYGSSQTVTSSPVTVSVAQAPPPPAPEVVLTSPVSGQVFTAPATISLAVSLNANGNTITRVQFLNGTNLLGESTSSPYTFDWSGVVAGNYSLSARVVYGLGQTVTSASVPVVVEGLPAPWITRDIGTGSTTSGASYSQGLFRVKGAGLLGNYSDQFRFVYQPLTGDGEIIARLDSASDTGANARIGIMIRETLNTGSRYALVGMNPYGTVYWQRRQQTGGSISIRSSETGNPPNLWVRLKRVGSSFTAYSSVDGQNWTWVGSKQISMAANIHVGLVVASGSATTLNTATLGNVTVVP